MRAGVAGSTSAMELMVACGRIRAVYGAGFDLFGQLRDVVVVDFSDSPAMRSTFEAVLEEQRGGGPASAAMMSALLSQCLVMIFRRLAEQSEHKLAWLDALEDPRLARVVGAVLDRPAESHSLERLAELAGMSRSVFAKRFHDGLRTGGPAAQRGPAAEPTRFVRRCDRRACGFRQPQPFLEGVQRAVRLFAHGVSRAGNLSRIGDVFLSGVSGTLIQIVPDPFLSPKPRFGKRPLNPARRSS